MKASINFVFNVVQVKSNADGSPRIVIDLLQPDVDKAAMLWAAKLANIPLQAQISAFDDFSLPEIDRLSGKNIKVKKAGFDLDHEISAGSNAMSGGNDRSPGAMSGDDPEMSGSDLTW